MEETRTLKLWERLPVRRIERNLKISNHGSRSKYILTQSPTAGPSFPRERPFFPSVVNNKMRRAIRLGWIFLSYAANESTPRLKCLIIFSSFSNSADKI